LAGPGLLGAGRSSIAPEQMVRALLLQVLYSIRRNRQLIEQIWYSRSFRWFVGLRIDEPKWNHAIFSMYREQLLQHEILREVLVRVLSAANREALVSAQALAAGRSELARAPGAASSTGRSGELAPVRPHLRSSPGAPAIANRAGADGRTRRAMPGAWHGGHGLCGRSRRRMDGRHRRQ